MQREADVSAETGEHNEQKAFPESFARRCFLDRTVEVRFNAVPQSLWGTVAASESVRSKALKAVNVNQKVNESPGINFRCKWC